MTEPVPPLLLDPVPVERPWGGTLARTVLDRTPPDTAQQPIGEWWLLSTRNGAATPIAGGERSLANALAQCPRSILGRVAPRKGRDFPLLLKILDSAETLSVQVHPSDAWVAGEGKTECWLVLAAAPDAHAYLGLRHGSRLQDFFDDAERGRDPARHLRRVPLATGDLVHIPAGLIHALGGGVLALEIQQNSDTTYRIYDWDRQPARPLHVAEARRVAAPSQEAILPTAAVLQSTPFLRESLVVCESFAIERLTLADTVTLATDAGAFQVLVALDHSLQIQASSSTVRVPRGLACLIPAGTGRYQVTMESPGSLIRVLPTAV